MKLDKKSFGVGLITPFAIALIAKVAASFTCCVWVGMLIIAVLLIAWKLMFTNTNFRKNVKRSVRVIMMLVILVLLLTLGVTHYMSHRKVEVGDEPTPAVVEPIGDVKVPETPVSDNDDNSNTGYTAPAGTITNKPDVKTTNVSSQDSEFTIGSDSDNTNDNDVEEKNTFTFEVTEGEPTVEPTVEDDDNNDDLVVPQTGEDISQEEVDNSQDVTAEENGGESETNTEDLPEVNVTGDVLVFDDEEEISGAEGNISSINTLEIEDTVVEKNDEDIVINNIQPQDEVKEEVVEKNDEVVENNNEVVEIEEVKDLEVKALDGYETIIGSQVQFEISDENATIDGLDGIDFDFSNGILTVNVGEEATTLTVDVISGSQIVTFDINVNGIIG